MLLHICGEVCPILSYITHSDPTAYFQMVPTNSQVPLILVLRVRSRNPSDHSRSRYFSSHSLFSFLQPKKPKPIDDIYDMIELEEITVQSTPGRESTPRKIKVQCFARARALQKITPPC